MSVKPTNIPTCHLRQSADSAGNFSRHGKLGEVTENIRTFALPFESQPYTFRMKYKYDSFNRMQQMTYPDGEVVSYGYNRGGMLYSIEGDKGGQAYMYVEHIAYNKYELKESVLYGNGSFATYRYDTLLRLQRLQSYTGESPAELMQDIHYTYDSVGNITHIGNQATMLGCGLGGTYESSYTYDNLHRLSSAGGNWDNGIMTNMYGLSMSYYPNGRIAQKQLQADVLDHLGNITTKDYDNLYSYPSGRNTLEQVEDQTDGSLLNTFEWDHAGNMTMHRLHDECTRRLCWDEENRLAGVADCNYASLYLYDANGERTYKLTGQYSYQNINGHYYPHAVLDNPTLYASPYVVCTPKGYTKHYYAESERITTQLGKYRFAVVDSCVAGDSLASVKLQNAVQAFPTDSFPTPTPMLGYLHSLVSKPKAVSTLYFYHPDHLGSASWITNIYGRTIQHLYYLPWGEDFVNQRTGSFSSMYTFSAKEKDTETGYSYFGARYYSSDLSIWLSVDPMSDKYPSLSPYVYCADNPVKLVDPNGMEYGNPIEDALKVIRNFEHSITTYVFRNIPKSKFIEDLTQHIIEPVSIQQGENGTCGAAVLSKYMAENHPVLYAEAAISLYTTGEFTHNGISLSLPNKAFSGSMTDLNKLGINSVDAIMQGAFTNSQNIIFNYNPFKDGSGFKSFMYPGYFNYYVSGFLGANYHCVLSPTTEYINSLNFVNHFVVGIVHSNDYSIEGGFPNHYIQILKSGNNKMDYWTWGEIVNGSTINNSLRNGFYMIISIGL